MADDPLDRLLDLGLAEKTLGPDTIRSFAEALRERARLVLDERVRGLEERVALLEKESAWRGETIGNLEEENRWRKDAIETLEERVAVFEKENHWRCEAMQTLEGENRWRSEAMATLEQRAAAGQRAAEAHDRLLAHHRDTLKWLVDALEKAAGTKGWGARRRVREQLGQVLAALRKELA